MQSTSKSSIVVDGVTYINEALFRQHTISAKICSQATNESGLPLLELDTASGVITIRPASEPQAFGRPELKVCLDASGRSFCGGIGMGISQEQPDPEADVMRRVQNAARAGAEAGFRAVLKELKR